MKELAFVSGELPSEALDRFWRLMEAYKFEEAILEVEKVAVTNRLGGMFWVELAAAADSQGMTTEAARYLERSEVRVRDW